MGFRPGQYRKPGYRDGRLLQAQATTAAATASAQPNRHRPRPLLLRLQNQRCTRPLWPPCTSSVRALPLQPVILHPPFGWRKPTPLWRRRHHIAPKSRERPWLRLAGRTRQPSGFDNYWTKKGQNSHRFAGHIDQEEGELRQARDIEQLGHLTEEIGHDLSNLMTILQYCLEMLSGRQANPQLQAKVDMALQTIDRAE